MSKKIKGVEILCVDIEFYCKIPDGSLNIGLLTLENEGRTFVLDTVESRYHIRNNATSVEVKLAVDEDLVEGCKYDLTANDLHSNTLKASLWWEEDVENSNGGFVDPDSITLFVRFNNDDGSGCTKAIDVNLD
jgi:hypothetical protein